MPMATYLVIVESPAKSKTIEKYLGSNYAVTSSKGHIRDLVTRGYGGYGVDIEDQFKPKYKILKEKQTIVKDLKKLVKKYDKVLLATDPDREGEAISWHLLDTLALLDNQYERVVFHEITKPAVLKAIEHARSIDMDLVKSQESRRIIDRIIGFDLSKLLKKKIGSKSAGRVQSVALKLIVDREKEIQAFIPEEYWDLFLEFEKDKTTIKAKCEKGPQGKIQLKNETQVKEIIEVLNPTYQITDIVHKIRDKAPRAPFITSTLQQEAATKFGFNVKRTMSIAQALYEGIELGDERVGLITYMRTDSTRLSDEFIAQGKKHIIDHYSEEYYRGYHNAVKQSKKIQDAHEAIRPSHLKYTPKEVKSHLKSDEFKLYSLIYARALSALMANAKIEDTKYIIDNQGYIFETSGERIVFDGYMKVYGPYESREAEELPTMEINEVLQNPKIVPEQKFTNPPYRYSEARLIKEMEKLGIGRPSTYAVTMETLRIRNYAHLEKKMFVPTEQGILTTEKLEEYFSSIINVEYTKEMEDILDQIADGECESYVELEKFYKKFKPLVDFAEEKMVKIYPVVLEEKCPECGEHLVIRKGRFGDFVACGGFPKCRYIQKKEKDKPKSTGVKCPNCETGMLVERISKRGRNKGSVFFACDQYPKCKTALSSLPEENQENE